MSWRAAAAWLGVACLTASCGDSPILLTPAVSTTEEPAVDIAEQLGASLTGSDILLSELRYPEPDEGVNETLERLRNGEVDLVVTEEPARPSPNLSTIVPLYPNILHVLVKKEIKAAPFGELIRGRQVYAGPLGGASARLLINVASVFGLSERDYRLLPDPFAIEPDVFFVLGGLLAEEGLQPLSQYRFHSFGGASGLEQGTVAEGIALRFPNIRPFLLPASTYGSMNPTPVLTLQTRTVLVARDDLDADVAYRIAETLVQHNHDLATVYPLVLSELNPSFDAASVMLPLHRGARRYLDKDEPSFVERYADVIGIALTVLAAIGSGVLTAVRVSRARRKDRIDVYYRRVLDVRQALQDDAPDGTHWRALEEKTKQIQEEVLQLLIEERLNVDESLTLFFDLSNRVLLETRQRAATD